MRNVYEGPYRLTAIFHGSGPYTAQGFVHKGESLKNLATVDAPGEYATSSDAMEAGLEAARLAARLIPVSRDVAD